MRVDLFDFELPPELIALRPARPRDSARLRQESPQAAQEASRLPPHPSLLGLAQPLQES